MLFLSIITSGLFLAYANGSNDNFKGVATLYGSHTATYKQALAWATLFQIVGSLTALVTAHGLLVTFSGKGLVPDSIIASPHFPLTVGLSAATTVILATLFGLPVSTTHALTGALIGAGFVNSQLNISLTKLNANFFFPLLISPLLAIIFSFLFYLFFRKLRVQLGISKETCLCVGNEIIDVVPVEVNSQGTAVSYQSLLTTIGLGTKVQCKQRYKGAFIGIEAETLLNTLHFLSGSIVCFARGLNDTPKIVAIFLVGNALLPSFSTFHVVLAVTLSMAFGGILNSKKVAETISQKVTSMNSGQGFSANFITGLMVIFASHLGMPVSTTHVSVGSLFGIGIVNKQADKKIIRNILIAWVTTLPLAAVISMIVSALCK